MILTNENLHDLGTKSRGFNRKQIEYLGLKWPPRKGWLKSLVGTEISDEDYEQLKMLKSFTRNKKLVNSSDKIKEAFKRMSLEDQARTAQLLSELKTLVNKYKKIQTYEQT